MGRHVNDDAPSDATDPDGNEPTSETARHASRGGDPTDGLIEDNAVISPDTHVGVDFDRLAPGTPDVAPSPAHPDALIENGLVGDGHEME